MNVIVVKDYKQLSSTAADIVSDVLKSKCTLTLGLATGSTVLGLYRELIGRYRSGDLSFEKVTTFNLDEYVGLEPTDPQSYHFFMWKQLFSKVDILRENVFIPRGDAPDLETECRHYEELIESKGPIDLQLLGIGVNGHIGFNEPGSALDSETRVVTLARETIEANARFFGSKVEVPRKAITMGIGSILRSKRIVLLASGGSKADALAKAVDGPITRDVPASALRLHSDVTIIADRDAASMFPNFATSRCSACACPAEHGSSSA